MPEEAGIEWPRRGDYAELEEYVEARDEAVRRYFEVRNRHRVAAVEAAGRMLERHEGFLSRSPNEPGWVKDSIDKHEARIKKQEDGAGARTLREVALITMFAIMILTFSLNLVKG